MIDDDETAAAVGEIRVRATVTGTGVWLNPQRGFLIRGGPASMTLERLRGRAVVVDLRIVDGDEGREVIVSVPPNAPSVDAAARARLLAWAAALGHRRLWLPDAVLDVDSLAVAGRRASVRCPACTSVWSDDSACFWRHVRAVGHFPGYCAACGASMPEWTVDDVGARADAGLGPRGAAAVRRTGRARG